MARTDQLPGFQQLVSLSEKRPPRRVDAMLVGTGRLIYAGVRAVAAGCGWPGGRVL